MTEPILTYLVIAEDGTSHEHHHRMTGTDSIATVVHAALDGWPEHIRVGEAALALWCDEDGRPHGRPVNPVGSRLALLLGDRPAAYVGPIVVTGMRGNTPVSLTAEQVEQLLAGLQLCRR